MNTILSVARAFVSGKKHPVVSLTAKYNSTSFGLLHPDYLRKWVARDIAVLLTSYRKMFKDRFCNMLPVKVLGPL